MPESIVSHSSPEQTEQNKQSQELQGQAEPVYQGRFLQYMVLVACIFDRLDTPQ